MEPVLTAAAMREADRQTIDSFGIPGFTLMETAGREAARVIETRLGSLRGRRVVCLCGPGNNGGDGYVVARVLYTRGARVAYGPMAAAEAHTEDAGRHLALLERLRTEDPVRLDRFDPHDPDTLHRLREADVLIDALLGTGLKEALRPPYQAIVDAMNAAEVPIVALDIPTGVDSDTGDPRGRPIRATGTVTMGAPKAGLVIGDGPDWSGWVETVEIGIPTRLLEKGAHTPGAAFRTTDTAIRQLLPERPTRAHKYTVGAALIVAGSVGYTGAAALAARAAAHTGAGAIFCATPAPAQPVLATKLTETMTVPLPAGPDGLEPGALGALAGPLTRARALLVGPGLGRGPGTQRELRRLLAETALPTVVDADALFALDEADIAGQSAGRWILTPHSGEFQRLAGNPPADKSPFVTATTYARRWQCTLILKGMPSVVATPDGQAYVCGTGNSLLATAGAGDVLAGLCTGFLARGLSPRDAALCALHLGGASADWHRRHVNPLAMSAGDLIDHLPELLRTRFLPAS